MHSVLSVISPPGDITLWHVQYIGPIAIDCNMAFVSIMNPSQTLAGLDWAMKQLVDVENTVWQNLAGLLDMCGYSLGAIGPLSP